MSTEIQRRRGTAAQHTTFTGAAGELTVNTDNNTIHVHDGTTAGGFETAKVADIGVTIQGYDADTAKLDVVQSWTAAQRGATNTWTTTVSSVTPNFNTYQNFVWTLDRNLTLANPSTEAVGQSGFIVFKQDATGGRTISLGTNYKTAGGAGITLSVDPNAIDIVPYIVSAVDEILLGTPQLAFA